MQTKLALDVKARFLNLKKFKLKTGCSTKTALLANLVKDYLMLDPSVLSNCKTNTLKFFVKDVTAVSQVRKIIKKNQKLGLKKTIIHYMCSYTDALSFYKSQYVLCRTKYFEPAQKFDCIQCLFKNFCAGTKTNFTDFKSSFCLPQNVCDCHNM